MRYSLTSEHLHFFRNERFICFDELLNYEQIEALKEPVGRLSTLSSPLERYQKGHDLFRENAEIRSLALKAKWAEIAGALFDQKLLQLAYTQHICGKLPFAETLSMKEFSAFTEISGGLLVNLSTGRSIFLAGDCGLSKTGWTTTDAQLFLIAYMPIESRYILNPLDPCVHNLKKLGYGFGDRLESETNPIIKVG